MPNIDIGDYNLTESSTSRAGFPSVGIPFWNNGLRIVAVQVKGADAVADGDVVGVFSTTPAAGHVSVTAATMVDCSDATNTVSLVAGVAMGAIAASSYGFLWHGGWSDELITTDGSIEAGDAMHLADGTKVAATVTTALHHGIFGYGTEADSSTSLTGATLGGPAMVWS